ncbi:MAG: hypothetical protein H6730_03850 [Deltaproteobacteria bacterium]|nr:hypothetical protein [Deltaproteobacteria bacterium]
MRSTCWSILALCALAAGCHSAADCVDAATPVGALCAPADAPPDTPITLEAMEECGGCTGSISACEITATSTGVLTLRGLGVFCELPRNTACAAVCSQSRVTCQTPPLAEGDYVVRAAGSSSVSVTLRVRQGGTATACTL